MSFRCNHRRLVKLTQPVQKRRGGRTLTHKCVNCNAHMNEERALGKIRSKRSELIYEAAKPISAE